MTYIYIPKRPRGIPGWLREMIEEELDRINEQRETGESEMSAPEKKVVDSYYDYDYDDIP